METPYGTVPPRRRAVVLAALVAPLLAMPASAAPAAPYCGLVKDPVPDAYAVADGVASPRNDDAMDIKELDLATDATSLTAVMRLYSLNTADVMSPTGRLYTFTFTVRKKAYPIAMHIAWNGTATSDRGAVPVIDNVKYELRTTVPLATFGLKKMTSRDRFTRLEGVTQRWAGDRASGSAVGAKVDTAGKATAYPHGARSCVRVGA